MPRSWIARSSSPLSSQEKWPKRPAGANWDFSQVARHTG